MLFYRINSTGLLLEVVRIARSNENRIALIAVGDFALDAGERRASDGVESSR